VTETVQTLADGNRIRRVSSAQVYRDSEGRTRREPSLASIGLAPDLPAPQLVFLNDPVTGFNYVLDPKARTAQKSKAVPLTPHLAQIKSELHAAHPGENATFQLHTSDGGTTTHTFSQTMTYRTEHTTSSAPKTEVLGRQTVEGVAADGTRTTITLAAGAIGNERPIDIVTERWYSPELQAVVMSKHSDPRMGENVYRLTNISRSEPARSLFEVPADYQVKESKGGGVMMKIRTGEPEKK
jgi:hypothetical protein